MCIRDSGSVDAGSGAMRNIRGNTHSRIGLGRELTDLHAEKSALIFSSDLANEATLAMLDKRLQSWVIFSDELNQASMIAGSLKLRLRA